MRKNMSDKILEFRTQGEISVDKNIQNFIDECKNELDLWNSDYFEWDSIYWDISGYFEFRSRPVNSISRLIFCTYESTKNKKHKDKIILPEPFCSFAKSYIRKSQTNKKTKSVFLHLQALRLIEFALRSRTKKSDIKYISTDIMDDIVFIIKDSSSYSDIVCALQIIYDFIRKNQLSLSTLPWSAPKTKSKSQFHKYSMDEEAIKRREEKLPTSECLYAIAKIFTQSNNPVDVLGSSIAVLLLSNPCRIGEVLTQSYDLEVHNFLGEGSYGLRWFPEKGGEPSVKYPPNDWIPIIKQAIENIKNLSNEARLMAQWYEDNAEGIYLPSHLAHLNNVEYLSLDQVRTVLDISVAGLDNFIQRNVLNSYKNNPKITGIETNNISYRVMLKKDIDEFVRSKLPKTFPYRRKGLKFSESLFVLPYSFTDRTKNCYSQVMFQELTYNPLRTVFSGDKTPSMFKMNELKELNGDIIQFRSHTARHWQNHLANLNAVPEWIQAFWSGRKSIQQNSAYYHATDDEKYEGFTKAVTKAVGGKLNMREHKIEVYDSLKIIKNRIREVVGTAHITDTGFCLHDVASDPCQKAWDHVACSKHIYLKGDPRNELLRSVQEAEIELVRQYEERNAREGNIYNMDVWPTSKKQHIAIRQNAIDVLDNNDIPNGVFFSISYRQ
jgi:hypothetical protein